MKRVGKITTFGTKLSVRLLRSKGTPRENREIARWVRDEVVNLGPTFIKLGQLASTRSDILTPEVIEEFSLLQSDVPPFADPWKSLDVPVDELFSDYDEIPLASASLGQVHRAVLRKGGEEVVVKIQRPGMEEIIRDDIGIIRVIASAGALIDDNFGEFVEILDEWEPLILEELDYQKEAKNMKDFRRMFRKKKWIRVPSVYEDISTRNMLVMSYEPGVKIVDVEALRSMDADTDEIAFYVIKSQFQQILEGGLFHADPHPGNLSLNDRGQIVYYDFGLVMRIDPNYKENLYGLLDAVYKKDLDKIYKYMIDLEIIIPRGDPASIKTFLKLFLNYIDSVNIEDVDVEELRALEDERPFRLSTMWILLIKSIFSVEGIAGTLSPNLKLADVLRPYAESVIEESGLLDTAFEDIQQNVMRMPGAIKSIRETVDGIEKGNIQFKNRVGTLVRQNDLFNKGMILMTLGILIRDSNSAIGNGAVTLSFFVFVMSRL